MEEEKGLDTMKIIAGAAEALDYKEKNPRATEQEIMQHITDNAEKILTKIDNPL